MGLTIFGLAAIKKLKKLNLGSDNLIAPSR